MRAPRQNTQSVVPTTTSARVVTITFKQVLSVIKLVWSWALQGGMERGLIRLRIGSHIAGLGSSAELISMAMVTVEVAVRGQS